jgi:hypothetical protein
MDMKDFRDARGATSRHRHQSLALVLIGTAVLLMLAACSAPAAAPATPATQPTAAPATAAPAAATAVPAVTATTAPKPTDKPVATATEAPKPTEKPAATAAATTAPAATATQAAPPAAKAASVSFAKDVKPILDEKCAKCHGGEKTEEGLSFKTYEDLMKGSNNGAVVKPGDAAGSDFVKLVTEGKMPKRATRLPANEIKILTDWVNAGAPNN